MNHSPEYEPILLEHHCPADARHQYDYNHSLVVPTKCVLYSYSGSRNHLHFVWNIPSDLSETDLLQRNMTIQKELQKNLRIFHTRAMRREFIHTFGVATHAKPAFLQEAYRHLTGDATAANTAEEAEVDKRVAELLDTEDPDLVWDLQLINPGRPDVYTTFLEECQRYITSTVETAVDEHRHDTVEGTGDVITHLARALSVRDLHEEVVKRCAPGTPIPLIQWLRFQFWPQRASFATSQKYTGRLKIKFMIQS